LAFAAFDPFGLALGKAIANDARDDEESEDHQGMARQVISKEFRGISFRKFLKSPTSPTASIESRRRQKRQQQQLKV